MMNDSARATRLVLLRRFLLALAVLVSAVAVAVVGFAGYLFTEGYSGGGSSQSVAPLAFPLAFLVLAIVGLPVALACAASWIGYLAAARRSRSLP
jgi:FtsH-binding integral membrane protein